MNKNTHLLTFLLFFFAIAPQIAFAEIFKCTNDQGAVFYNDKPCPVKDKEKKFNSIKDPKNGYIPEKYQNKKVPENKNLLIGEDKIAAKNRKKKDADNNQIESVVEAKKKKPSMQNAQGIQKNSSSSRTNATGSNSPKKSSDIKVNVSGIKITKAASARQKKLLLDAPGIIH